MPKKKTAKKEVTKEVSKKQVKKAPKYQLEVGYHDQVFKSAADTIEEALKTFVESPELPIGFKSQVVIKTSKGKDERRRIMGPAVARRVFGVYKVRPESISILARTLTRQFDE